MKKLLRRWLSIDDILFNQQQLLSVQTDLADVIQHLEDIEKFCNLNKFEKLEQNTTQLNSMMLELKGIVSIARAMVDQGKTKPK